MAFHYRCSECDREYTIQPEISVCPDCSRQQEPQLPLRGILEVVYSGKFPRDADPLDFLPVPRKFFPPIPVGGTPLWEPERLRAKLGFPRLFIKDDSLNPTGSLKDRASFLVAAFARQHGVSEIAVASTGNAGSSMAGVGAAAGLKVTLFISRNAPRAKLVQSRQYGAEMVLVDGSYDQAYDLSLEHTQLSGALSRNTAYNPLTIEGKKTAALEIVRQLSRCLGNSGCPDHVFVPAGDGVILSGVYKGLRDLKDSGWIRRFPKVHAVQAEGSQAISRALRAGGFGPPIPSSTVADSLAVDVPRGGYHALKQLQEYDGECIAVSDPAILKAQRELASECGLFAEPAASAVLAGFHAVKDGIPRDAAVVLLITGSGLKDPASAEKGLELEEMERINTAQQEGDRKKI